MTWQTYKIVEQNLVYVNKNFAIWLFHKKIKSTTENKKNLVAKRNKNKENIKEKILSISTITMMMNFKNDCTRNAVIC